MNRKMNAKEELLEFLEEGEKVEVIVFGAWGWGEIDPEKPLNKQKLGYGEPEDIPVPVGFRGKILTFEKAKKYMDGWSFYGGYGAPECYATCIWTNQRIIWVTQYDGSTGLDSAPRNPIEHVPAMPGG